MRRTVTLLALLCTSLYAQDAPKPATFEIAGVQKAPKRQNAFSNNKGVHGGRWEIKTATMLDLIRTAYGFQNDKILGGPNWLEMDRFDIDAKVPPDTSPDAQKEMLQSLLAERFSLKVRKENKPLPTFALVVGKKPLLKEADGTGESGCKPHEVASSVPRDGAPMGMFMFVSGPGAEPVQIRLGPGSLFEYSCRNMSMDRFVQNMRGMFGAQVGTNPLINETGLKGNFDFDLRYSMGGGAADADRIPFATALEKQLGLILEPRQVATPVLIVESANETPTPDPPGIAEALPPIPVPTEFDVASVKLAEPVTGPRMFQFGMQAGGRFRADAITLRNLMNSAFNVNNREAIVDVPDFANSARFDITARAADVGASAGNIDNEDLAPLICSLLVDRFKMKYHSENREVTTYKLVVGKSKLKPADPANRANCKNQAAPAGSPPASRMLVCQNVTVAEFADRLQNMSQELNWPVDDATGIEGRFDISLTYSRAMNFVARGGGPGAQASDPTGGYTVFEAIEKELGLKLEKQKKSMPVIVIDHIEAQPTEN